MGTPPNQTGKRFPNRKSALNTPVRDAISMEYSQHLLEELAALEPRDIKQIRKIMNDLFAEELDTLLARFGKLRDMIYEIKYDRSPKGIVAREARNAKRRKQVTQIEIAPVTKTIDPP